MSRLKKIKELIKKKEKWVIVLFFSLFFLYGCVTFRDFGLSGDEGIQRYHSLVMYKYLVPSVGNIVTDTVNFPTVPDPKSYGVYYGVTVQLPTVVIEHLFGFQLDLHTVFLIRHFYNFLIFFIATIFFYRICYVFTNRRYWALLGTFLLIVSPRILGDAFYNVKDLMGLSAFVVNLYFAILFIKKISIKSFIGLILSSALCINVRIVGGVIIASCLFLAFIRCIADKTLKHYWLYFVGTGAGCFGLYLLMTPVTWGNVFEVLLKTIKTFSNYSVWINTNFYFGKNVEAMHLPWHYLPVWIFISTPIVYSLFCIVGILSEGFRLFFRRNKTGDLDDRDYSWNLVLIFMCMVIPFLYVILLKPVLYTGWRHFYFIYPLIILFALVGFKTCVVYFAKKKAAAISLWGILGFSVITTILWIGCNHPYEYVYFNPLVRPYVDENFEKDYWGTSGYAAILYILNTDISDSIKIYAKNTSGYDFLEKDQRARISIVNSVEEADYVVETYSAVSQSKKYNEFQEFDEIHSLIVDGFYVNTIFKRSYEHYSTSILTLSNGIWNSSIDNITWECNNDTAIAIWKEPVRVDKVTIEFENKKVAEKSEVYATVDGDNWVCISDKNDYKISGNQIWGHISTEHLVGIKVVGVGERITLNIYQNRAEEDAITHPQSIVRVLGHENSPDSEYAIDNNPKTNWHSNTQHPDIVFDIELDSIYHVSGLRLDPGQWKTDYPRKLRIFISEDGQSYGEVNADSTENIEYFFEAVKCQYIRLITGDTQEVLENDWTISEVAVFQTVE